MKVKIDIASKLKILKQKKGLAILCAVLIAVLAVGGFLTWRFTAGKVSTKSERVTAKVTRGTVINSIEGSGTLEAISQYEITSLAKGDVISDHFEEGDYVTKGQLLYQIDSASVDKSITKQKNNVEKAQNKYRDAMEGIEDLNVKSTANGVITNLYVSIGDTVQQGAKIADVTDKRTLTVTLPFGKHDTKYISAGDVAEITFSKSLTTINGSVTRVATGTYVNSYGVEVTDVDIEFQNPGSVAEGESVSAVVASYACYDSGEIKHIDTRTVTARASGEVKHINRAKGDSVSKGDVIVSLDSSSASETQRDARISLQDANLSLDDLYDNLEDYSITSPIDGKVIQKNIKAGEKLESNSSGPMAIVADLSRLTFDISIDELDISKIKTGQSVSVTADALPNQTFEGSVTNISIVGSAYQGVTSYPVTVTIDNTEESGLIPGMNVEAQIVVDSAENVLRIPVSAVNMGNLVIVKDDGTFADPEDMIVSTGRESSKNTGKEERSTTKDNEQQIPPRGGFSQDANTGSDASADAGIPKRDASKQMPSRGELPSNPSTRPNVSSDTQLPDHDNSKQIPVDTKFHPDENKESNDASDNKADTGDSIGKMPSSQELQEKSKERIKAMIKNLDVPDGYTVVRVTTGLTDGSYIEVLEAEGSLNEGDEVLLAAVSATSESSQFGGMGGMPGGMGGMPGGMGGMPGGMGGMPRSTGGMGGGTGSRTGSANRNSR